MGCSVVIVTFDICALVMFPVNAKSTLMVACIVVWFVASVGVGVGEGEGLAVGLGVGDAVGASVCVGVGNGEGVGVGSGSCLAAKGIILNWVATEINP